jgi:hypothetical protein
MPCYWTGTTRTDLPLPAGADYAIAESIFVYDGVAYAAGYYRTAGPRDVPCYWDGSGYHELENNGTNNARARSIYVDGGTIYTAGYQSDGVKNTPCYWTGTTRTDLPLVSSDGEASSIFVSAGTVYVAGGYVSPLQTACYWTDVSGTITRFDLPVPAGTSLAEAYSISVYGGTAYIAGRWSEGVAKACYWVEDATQVPLPGFGPGDYSAAVSICVSDGTVYAAGTAELFSGGMGACYWTDMTQTGLTASGSTDIQASAIAAAGGSAYVAGFYWDSVSSRYVACYWTGSERYDLPGPGLYDAEAHAIFLVE